jgi:hypothetical protein
MNIRSQLTHGLGYLGIVPVSALILAALWLKADYRQKFFFFLRWKNRTKLLP